MTAPFYARGAKGTSIDAVTVDGDDLVFAMTEGPAKRATVPQLDAATTAATAAAQAAADATTAKTDAQTARIGAETAETNAAGSATAAAGSADDAAGSVAHAQSAETAATAAAGAAATSATTATIAVTDAQAARDDAQTARTAAQTAETNAAGHATDAASSATTAAGHATDAATARTGAETADTSAAGHAADAATARTGAETAATSAAGHAADAASSATSAESSNIAAAGHATAAAGSAAAAQQSAEDAASVVNDGIPNASTSIKGGIKIAGDLAGTWDAPTVPGLADRALAARTVTGGPGLTGGGDLTASRTIAADFGTTAGKVCEGNDLRLTDQRTPTDGSVTTAKLADGAVTIGKLAPAAAPHDMTLIAAGVKTKRAPGTMDNWAGISLRRPVTVKSVLYRFATADASGSTSVELRKNGVAIAGTSKAVAAADQTNAGGAPRTVSGLSVMLAAGDILTVHVTAVGTTPGAGLVADIEGTLA